MRYRLPINSTHLVAAHHNWIGGDENKWVRAVAYETVLESDNETLAHFRRRARHAIDAMPAWQWRNPAHPGNAKVSLRTTSRTATAGARLPPGPANVGQK